MSLGSAVKDHDATLDYGIDWEPFLNGDLLTGSSWAVPGGITQVTASFTTTTTTVWLSGGTIGSIYTITNHVSTALGRIDERSIDIRIEEK